MHAAVIGDYPSPADPHAEFVDPAGFVLFFRIQKDIWDPSTVPGAIRRAAEQRFDRTIEAPLAAIDLPAWVELRFAWDTPEQAVVGTLEDAFAVREIALLSLKASSGAEIEGDGAYRPLCPRPASPEVTAWFPPSPPGPSLSCAAPGPPGPSLSCAAPGPPWRSRGAALEPARAYALLEPVPQKADRAAALHLRVTAALWAKREKVPARPRRKKIHGFRSWIWHPGFRLPKGLTAERAVLPCVPRHMPFEGYLCREAFRGSMVPPGGTHPVEAWVMLQMHPDLSCGRCGAGPPAACLVATVTSTPCIRKHCASCGSSGGSPLRCPEALARALFADVFASESVGPQLELYYQKIRERKQARLSMGKSVRASRARHKQLMNVVGQPMQAYTGPRRKRRKAIAR